MLHGNNGLENKSEVDPFAGMMSEEKIKQSENIGIYDIHTEEISEFRWDIYLEVKNRKIKILSIDTEMDSLSIYPFISFQNNPYFLEEKKDTPTITLEGFGVILSDDVEELISLIPLLPTGIYNKLDYGYGLKKQYHMILHHIPCPHLVISKTLKTKLENNIYTLNYDDYEILRKAIDRITNKYRNEAIEEKELLVHNTLLSEIDSIKYPKKHKAYKKDTIFKILTNQNQSSQPISKNDKKIIVDSLKNNTKDIYKTEKPELLKLAQDIKLINLEDLISIIKDKINTKKQEEYWQQLFNENPFILSLAFNYPVIKLGREMSVGGRKITGDGGKITDFLVKNKLTDNVAIIEIKKPQTQLLQKTFYRGSVYAPDKELSGSVNQLLDQKFHFQQEFAQIMFNSKINDSNNYHINCILIIGITPEDEDKKKSFELFRNSLKDITIVTFDELLGKLQALYEFLSNIEKK